MKSQVISTGAGTFILSSPTSEILRTLGKWPEGVQVKSCDEHPLIEITVGNPDYEVDGLCMNLIGYNSSLSAVSGQSLMIRAKSPVAG